ncbi:hypothetical protein P7I20_14735 [Enterococcus casseliflavus]|uniref:hypothetical protein n=1 Tax=Enterococcus casseliflavus TaxID=37734 RepID=UPI0028913497|nr:hypothetical protein [Enterococcus casseliflavus]MDT2980635.1 hypothetical protein [Enterococcus casseliflavus]
MDLKLKDFDTWQISMGDKVQEDLTEILNMMNEEGIDLGGWSLVEIPFFRTYCFYNNINLKAFDMEENFEGNLSPHYYKIEEISNVTKHPTKTIIESINNYRLMYFKET